MGLTLEEIRRIGDLSRLELSAEEEAMYRDQLGRVVDYIDQLKAFTSHSVAAGESSQAEAADVPSERQDVGWFVDNAPQSLDRFLLVPQVKGSDSG